MARSTQTRSGTIIQVFGDGTRLIRWENGCQSRVPFKRCPLCKKDRPETGFIGALCLDCRGVRPAANPKGFLVTKAGKQFRYASERYARERQATPPWIKREDFADLYEEARRLTRETGIPHQVDHIWPLQHESFSGLHVPWNLRVIPSKQNGQKHAKAPLDYLQQITYG